MPPLTKLLSYSRSHTNKHDVVYGWISTHFKACLILVVLHCFYFCHNITTSSVKGSLVAWVDNLFGQMGQFLIFISLQAMGQF